MFDQATQMSLEAPGRAVAVFSAVAAMGLACESPAPDVEALPLSPFRAGKLATDVGARDAYERDREKWGPPDSVASDLSFYDPETRTIWFCTAGSGLGTLGHEAVHPLLQGYGDGDFPHAPARLSEGLSALFEVVTYDDKTGDAQFGAHFRIKSLRTALKRTAYAPKVTLDHLFTLRDDKSFKQDRALAYALSREALRFMRQKHGDALWRFYRSFRDGVLTDPTGEHAFASSMDGKTPADVTPEFLAWVQSSESGPL